MSEEIVLLNETWDPIGRAPKLASHHADTPLHLAFSCYVFNEAGKVLVTQRAKRKKVWPGIWTNSCCGHPAPEESMDAAIRRRFQYELGLEVTDIKLILPKFRYRAEFNGIVENECCPVFVARTSAELLLNSEEVMDYKWLSWEELCNDSSAEDSEYSYWCKKQIPLLSDAGVGAVNG